MAELALQVFRDMAGAVVNITSARAMAADEQKITGYLLDLSGLKQTASELEFFWQKRWLIPYGPCLYEGNEQGGRKKGGWREITAYGCRSYTPLVCTSSMQRNLFIF